ncbi:hypothetical protein JFT63_07690 [Pseudomonas sp. MF7453]|nr:hypothetical protein [Pseudomonas sp. MF7453]MBJ2217614.1 hypothetical protein [Pseudomonas sp. MF7453]
MPKNNDVPIKNNNGIFVGKDRKERVEHNATISIGNHRAEDVGQNETISIGGNRSVTISGAVTTAKFRLRCTMFETTRLVTRCKKNKLPPAHEKYDVFVDNLKKGCSKLPNRSAKLTTQQQGHNK